MNQFVEAQKILLPSIYAALRECDWDNNNPQVKVLNDQYDVIVQQAIQEFGADADCREIDYEMCGSFSDIYKSDNGFRPSGFFSYNYVDEYLKARRQER